MSIQVCTNKRPKRSLRDVIKMVPTDNGDLVSVSYWTNLNQLCPNAILVQSPGIGLGPTNFLNFFKDVADIGVLCCLP